MPLVGWIGALAIAVLGLGCGDGDGDPDPPPLDGGPGDVPCEGDLDCDDELFCNGIERCVARRCEPALVDPCDDGIDCTDDSCLEEVDRCFTDPRNERCADDDACNGVELCVVGEGCQPGEPTVCEDLDPCTVDDCLPATGCSFQLRDLDFDGFAPPECGGTDCDDDPRTGVDVYPGAMETCGDDVDSDCDGVDDYADDDCPTGNDFCDDRIALPEAGASDRFNTFGLTDDVDLRCGTEDEIDAVFGLSLGEPQDVTVTVEGLSDEVDGAVTVEARPADECAGTDVAPRACVRGAPSGTPVSLFTRALSAGEHVFVVEAPETYEVTVAIDPATPFPATDRCGPETAPVPTTETEGFFSDAQDDYLVSCTMSTMDPHPDAAFLLRLEERSAVALEAEASGASVRLALTERCETPAAIIACGEARSVTVSRPELPAGDYFVLVEPGALGDPTFELQGTISPAADFDPGDACSTAADAVPDGPAVTVDATAEFGNLIGTSCRSAAGDVDVVAQFEIDVESTVAVTVDAGGPHALALRAGDCQLAREADELACSDVVTPTQVLTGASPLQPGTYQAVVSLPAPVAPATETTVTISVTTTPTD